MTGPRRHRQAWLGFFISAVVLALVLTVVDVRTLGAALRRLPVSVLAVAVALMTLSIGLRAWAWRILLGGRITWAEGFWALNIGYLVNNVIPMRAGEAARAVLIAPRAQISFWHALSTVMVERLLDVALLASMLLGSLPWVLDLPQARRASLGLGGVALVGLGVLALLARYREPLRRILEERLPARLKGRGQRVLRWLLGFLDGLEALADPWASVAVLWLLLISWAVQVVAYGLTLQALVPQASLLWAAFALGSVGMGIAVPSAPGGLGVMEGVLVFVLSALGVEASVALAYALAMHGVYYLVTLTLGLVGIHRYGTSLAQVVGSTQRERSHEA